MVKPYIPLPDAEEFMLLLGDFARLLARMFKCKIVIRVDYKDGTFSVQESDHRKDGEG